MKVDMTKLIRKVHKDDISAMLAACSLEINGFGKWETEEQKILQDQMISDYKLVIIKEGQAEFTINRQTYTPINGDVLFIPPFTLYSAKTQANTYYRHNYLHFDINPIFIGMEFSKSIGNQHVFSFNDPLIDAMVEQIQEDVATQQKGTIISVHILLQYLLLKMFRRNSNSFSAMIMTKSQGNSVYLDVVKKSIVYIESHHQKAIRVKELGKHLNISESYLYKCFAKVLQMSPAQYILFHKVKIGKQMLVSEQYTIKEISNHLGFSSLYHFSSTFKNFYGASPKHYMKEFQNSIFI